MQNYQSFDHIPKRLHGNSSGTGTNSGTGPRAPIDADENLEGPGMHPPTTIANGKWIEQWKNPNCLGYIGDCTTQLYGDYNEPI